jgi:hypothetical protein
VHLGVPLGVVAGLVARASVEVPPDDRWLVVVLTGAGSYLVRTSPIPMQTVGVGPVGLEPTTRGLKSFRKLSEQRS